MVMIIIRIIVVVAVVIVVVVVTTPVVVTIVTTPVAVTIETTPVVVTIVTNGGLAKSGITRPLVEIAETVVRAIIGIAREVARDSVVHAIIGIPLEMATIDLSRPSAAGHLSGHGGVQPISIEPVTPLSVVPPLIAGPVGRAAFETAGGLGRV